MPLLIILFLFDDLKLTRLSDDWVDGKLIPKDTAVLINVWGLHHDPIRFPNPETFDPAHYLNLNITRPASEIFSASNPDDRDHYGYGAGRRLCPGIHLAERNLFLGIVKLLWAFDFSAGRDENGVLKRSEDVDVDPKTAYSEGFLVCANDFGCESVVRSERRRETILREFAKAEGEVFVKYQ